MWLIAGIEIDLNLPERRIFIDLLWGVFYPRPSRRSSGYTNKYFPILTKIGSVRRYYSLLKRLLMGWCRGAASGFAQNRPLTECEYG